MLSQAQVNHTELVRKYDQPLPRYTSYPTVPFWDKNAPDEEVWKRAIQDAWDTSGKSLSLYIHLLFCESLCTYCACNTRITTNHKVEEPYIDRLLKEWAMYLDVLEETPHISELHLGGGTPTFFSPGNLKALLDGIESSAIIEKDAALSFEAHPASTTIEHLQVLFNAGFKRISLGVQDFDKRVQKAIHRFQTPEEVLRVTNEARAIGYNSVNFDLIYGLPFQTEETIRETITHVLNIRPDRIAFYSYAHVPWMKPGQRGYEDADLPNGDIKRNLYETGRAMLEAAGYLEIGMDHFALPEDELFNSVRKGTLHRNFMGYTTHNNPLLLGIGPSSISDAQTMFSQNVKTLEEWNELIDNNKLPLHRGHLLSAEDLILRRHVLNVMCRNFTDWSADIEQCAFLQHTSELLKPLADDGLCVIQEHSVQVTPAGQAFLRNIAACFDARLFRSNSDKNMFSRTA
jgi:oxygen-independent coproporphyrinogen-3 oxidase